MEPVKKIHADGDVPNSERADVSADVRAWQLTKISAGLDDADQGRFATPEAVKAVIGKYVPNG